MKLKLNMSEDFNYNKEMFGFSSYFIKSKYNDDSNNLFIEKVKNKTGGMPIEEFFRLKLKIY